MVYFGKQCHCFSSSIKIFIGTNYSINVLININYVGSSESEMNVIKLHIYMLSYPNYVALDF